jgi:hypothetical protein
LGVKISSAAGEPVQAQPTFTTAEETPAPVAKKQKLKITKPDIEIPAAFGPNWGPSSQWKPIEDAPHGEIITAACRYPSQPWKWFYWPVMWFAGPHGPNWYICGTQWHSIDAENIIGWMPDIGHPEVAA